MTTPQIVILLILFVLGFGFYTAGMYSKTDRGHIETLTGLFFIYGITFSLLLVMILSNNFLENKANGKCPEYEKIEAYKLKEKP